MITTIDDLREVLAEKPLRERAAIFRGITTMNESVVIAGVQYPATPEATAQIRRVQGEVRQLKRDIDAAGQWWRYREITAKQVVAAGRALPTARERIAFWRRWARDGRRVVSRPGGAMRYEVIAPGTQLLCGIVSQMSAWEDRRAERRAELAARGVRAPLARDEAQARRLDASGDRVLALRVARRYHAAVKSLARSERASPVYGTGGEECKTYPYRGTKSWMAATWRNYGVTVRYPDRVALLYNSNGRKVAEVPLPRYRWDRDEIVTADLPAGALIGIRRGEVTTYYGPDGSRMEVEHGH